jgi:hypothetical protein
MTCSGGRIFMRNFRSTVSAFAMLLGAMPVVATAQANHNTARSNKNTVAAPAGDTGPAVGSGEEQLAGRKGYDRYQAQSDLAAVVAEPGGTGEPTDDQSAGPQQAGNAGGPDTPPPAETSN